MGRKTRRGKGRSMFYDKPRHRDIAEIVTIESPAAARKAGRKLLAMFNKAKTRKRKVTIKRSVVLAANRAEAASKRRNLSEKERREMKEVARIYRQISKKMEVKK